MNNLNLTMEQQCQTEWCWAAVAVSVAKFYCPANSVKQCDIANDVLKLHDCCSANPACNKANPLGDALEVNDNCASIPGGTITTGQLTPEIDNGRPVAVRVGVEGSGHFCVIDGYYETSLGLAISIRDPLFQTSIFVFDAFKVSYLNGGVWDDTYFTQKGNSSCQ
jgi:hypothetical protein